MITCRTCDKKIANIGEMADHISDTTQEEKTEWVFDSEEEMKKLRKEEPPSHPYVRGTDFNKWLMEERRAELNPSGEHTQYVDKNGKDMIISFAKYKILEHLLGGPTFCLECFRDDFKHEKYPNKYHLYEHIVQKEHCKDTSGLYDEAKEAMTIFQEFEMRYF